MSVYYPTHGSESEQLAWHKEHNEAAHCIMDKAGVEGPLSLGIEDRVARLVFERDEARVKLNKFSDADVRIQQTLAKALGYPLFADSLKHFPNATPEDGVCVGPHTGETLAAEAAIELNKAREEIAKLKAEAEAPVVKEILTTRPEPSRLEIAAMIAAGNEANPGYFWECEADEARYCFMLADALIAESKEVQG